MGAKYWVLYTEKVIMGVTDSSELASFWSDLSHENWAEDPFVITTEDQARLLYWGEE